MSPRPLNAQTLFEDLRARLGLAWVSGRAGAERAFGHSGETQGNPALVGHFNLIHSNQAQVLGKTELEYLTNLRPISREDAYTQLFQSAPVMLVIAGGEAAPAELARLADAQGVALLTSPASSNELINNLRYYFTHKLADRTTLHGVFLEVLSLGVLVTGDSGVGKSELALELISRGHRLIADDAPEFARIAPDIINGTSPAMLQDFLEVRGLGILNIRAMFGDSVVKQGKYLRLIVELRHAQPERPVPDERLQHRQRTQRVLGLDIPVITLPVAPGRNLAVLAEAAVRHHMLRLNGYDAGLDLTQRQQRLMTS